MNIYQAHLELLKTIPNKNVKFFRTTNKNPTKNYFLFVQICEKYCIPHDNYNIFELHWRLRNNDFSEKKCLFCNSKNIQFRTNIGFRKYCSTKCSAKNRDNETRKGFACEEGRKKAKDTLFERYGVFHQMHVHSIHEKQQKKRYLTYDIFSPSKVLYRVQGYERYVIPYLWEKYEENDLVVIKKDIPKIWYICSETNKKRVYYPDGFIKSKNAIVEIKSTYTINDKLLKDKIKYTLLQGFNFYLYLYDKGKIEMMNLTHSSSSISSKSTIISAQKGQYFIESATSSSSYLTVNSESQLSHV